jgi:hypothetical protein
MHIQFTHFAPCFAVIAIAVCIQPLQSSTPPPAPMQVPALTDIHETTPTCDFSVDGKKYTAKTLIEEPGGSGSFMYVAVFFPEGKAIQRSNQILLGDRVAVRMITFENGLLCVEYMDRRENETFGDDPTLPVKKYFRWNRGKLEESRPR